MPPTQLPLAFNLNPAQSFATYHAGTNSQVIEALQGCVEGTGEGFIFLWGEPGMGKTHLLHACCQLASKHRITASYIPLEESNAFNPSVTENLEQFQLLCFDNIESIARQDQWEQNLFHMFNRMRDKGNRLIISSRYSPTATPIELSDLATRLPWGLPLQLRPLDDSDKLAALTLRAKYLGFEINANVGRFLMNRYPRDMASLWQLLERLDYATLAAKRKLTIPFIKDFIDSGQGQKPV